MKLTPENVAAIERLLTRRENGEPASAVCPAGKSNLGKSAMFGHFIQILQAIGIDLPRQGMDGPDWEEFRAWKAARAAEKQREAISA